MRYASLHGPANWASSPVRTANGTTSRFARGLIRIAGPAAELLDVAVRPEKRRDLRGGREVPRRPVRPVVEGGRRVRERRDAGIAAGARRRIAGSGAVGVGRAGGAGARVSGRRDVAAREALLRVDFDERRAVE